MIVCAKGAGWCFVLFEHGKAFHFKREWAIGRYKFLSLLGSGAEGTVFLVEQTLSGKLFAAKKQTSANSVACKVIHPSVYPSSINPGVSHSSIAQATNTGYCCWLGQMRTMQHATQLWLIVCKTPICVAGHAVKRGSFGVSLHDNFALRHS